MTFPFYKYQQIFLIVIIGLSLSYCDNTSSIQDVELQLGTWRGVILQQGKELPFLFETSINDESKYIFTILNGEERLEVDEVEIEGDSVFITFNFFDTEIRALYQDGLLIGNYNKRYSDNHILPFKANFGENNRFKQNSNDESHNVSGRYQVSFIEDDGHAYPAVAKIEQNGSILTGTFLTETGDYRYLEGAVIGDSIKLSSFDGTHLFLFTSIVVNDSLLGGEFWHGKDTYETWSGVKNENASLTDPDQLTYLKEGYDKISFSFPDLNGQLISLDDPKYRNKVIILQIFGTWCPNCMDETKYYTKWFDDHFEDEVEIIGLAYENKPDFEYAKNRVEKMRKKLDVSYDFLIAGTSDKIEASKTLPMLNGIISFPTSIFIDKKGVIRKIHTGFSGPGTGGDYVNWTKSFESFMDELLAEK